MTSSVLSLPEISSKKNGKSIRECLMFPRQSQQKGKRQLGEKAVAGRS